MKDHQQSRKVWLHVADYVPDRSQAKPVVIADAYQYQIKDEITTSHLHNSLVDEPYGDLDRGRL